MGEDSATTIRSAAASRDVCIAIGIFEALPDEPARRLLEAILSSLPRGAVLYADNFLPDHHDRAAMEWFMDFHLVYRTRDEFERLLQVAGAKSGDVESLVDDSGSVGLYRVSAPGPSVAL
jgi:hypothetical protein